MANYFGMFYNASFNKSLRIRNGIATLVDMEELLNNNSFHTPDDTWEILERTEGIPCPDSVFDSDEWICKFPNKTMYQMDYGLPDGWEILTDHKACKIAGMNIKEIAKSAGISQRALARKYSIPYRTMEDWCAKDTCPIYVKMMLAECLGVK